MLHDILTVAWKERKGLFRVRGSRGRFFLTMLMPIVLAVVMPLQTGKDWLDKIPSILLAVAVPLILVAVTIPESFAGERERHTLGTLLASRLPDRAILFGKIVVSLTLAWIVTLIVLILSLATVNIAHWEGAILFYAPPIALADLLLSLMVATLVATTGVLISMRAQTVQQATQTLMAIFLVPPMLLQVVFFVFMDRLRGWIDAVNGQQLLVIVVAVLLLLSLALFAWALVRFRRPRLILV
jgi:ABC-2 type transport system permease protein